MEQRRKGYLKTLFDFSFSEFLTTKIVRILYIIYIIIIILAAIIGTIFSIIKFFEKATVYGILSLLFTPIIAILLTILFISIGRIYAEMIIVIFRIAEFTRDIYLTLGGKEVSPLKGEVASNYKFCTQCGAKNEAGNEFCKECGSRLS